MRKTPSTLLILLFAIGNFTARTQNCVLPLNGGTLSPISTLVCPTEVFTVYVNGASTGAGLNYQWQVSANNSTWTDRIGYTTANLTIMQTSDTWYRRKTECNGTGTVYSNSVLIQMKPFANCYCTPSSSFCTSGYNITAVSFGSINNTSGCSTNGYTNYSSTVAPADITQGTYQPISITTGSTVSRYLHCYVDFNQNGAFESKEYMLLSSPLAGVYSGFIKVPFGAKLGATRMRIVHSGNTINNSCYSDFSSETEDYAVRILPKTTSATGFAIYVKTASPGSNGTGSSWTNAMTSVRAAVTSATPGDTIKVAKGTYYAGASQTNGIVLSDSILVLGGYPDSGSPIDADRNPGMNFTVLSGLQNAGSTVADYHVLYASGVLNTCTVDGFVVQNGGISNGNTAGQNRGGGISIENGANITVRNCVFRNNYIYIQGSAICVNNAKPAFINCIVTGNNSSYSNIAVQNNANVTFTNLLAARNGGVALMVIDSSQSTMKNSTLSGNTSTRSLLEAFRQSTVSITNSISYHNAVYDASWQTTSFDSADIKLFFSSLSVAQSILQVNNTGSNLLMGVIPRFRDTTSVAGADGFFFTDDDGFTLQNPCSPAINAGSNNAAAGVGIDITGRSRVFGAAVDLGAYELQQAVSPIPKVIYVNTVATGANNGGSWADAYTDLHTALQACSDTIKVAAGTYYPLKNGLKQPYWLENKRIIWGAYPASGNPTDAARNFSLYPTIISGQKSLGINGNDIIRGQNLDSTAMLDGFTITSVGNSATGRDWGALLYTYCNNPIISNCRFTANARRLLVGRYNKNLLLSNCVFDANLHRTDLDQDLIVLEDCPGTTLKNCRFENNNLLMGNYSSTYEFGQIIYLTRSYARLDSCVFLRNNATVISNNRSNPLITRSQFLSNGADKRTTDILNMQSNPVIQQCIFRDSAWSLFSGRMTDNFLSAPRYTDCQFYDGRSSEGSVAYSDSSIPVFTNCVFSNCQLPFYNRYGSNIQLQNCIATGSSYTNTRAASFMQNERSNPVLNNCVVVNSKSWTYGVISGDAQSVPEINNSVFWRNFSTSGYDSTGLASRMDVTNATGTQSSLKVRNSMFEYFKPTAASNTTGKDPRLKNFTNPRGDDGVWFTADDGLQLCDCSPAINSGDNAYATTPIDISGKPRLVNGQLDRGAYELQTVPATSWPTVYVQATAGNSGDGSSWANAYNNLHKALFNACADTIKIAGGVYRPAAQYRDSAFTIDRNLVILGSFAAPSAVRDVEATPTIVSGDIGIANDTSDNSYGLLKASYVDSLMMDGLVFKDANSTGRTSGKNVFALYADYIPILTLANCRFVNNFSDTWGSAFYLRYVRNLDMRKTVFTGNKALAGAGAYFTSSGPLRKLTDCVFEKNVASHQGGGLWWSGSGGVLTNCVFTQNQATQGAGMFVENSPAITVTNCTFANNRLINFGSVGGGIYSSGYEWQGGGSGPDIGNCIFTGNGSDPQQQNSYGDLYYPKNGYLPGNGWIEWNINNSAISTAPASYPGNPTNIGAYYVTYRDRSNPIGPDGRWFTADDGLQLPMCSDVINKGNNAIVTVAKDVVGNNRIIGPKVDMGAYELNGAAQWTQLLTKASDSLKADKEIIDSAGWTHYYNACTYLLSLKKNGKNIGTVGDGSFEVKIVTAGNYSSGIGTNLTAASYNTSGLPWYVMNRYWNVKSSAVISDSILVRFPYTNADYGDVKGSNPIVTQHGQLQFFKVKGTNNSFDLNIAPANFTKYTNATSPSLITWMYSQLDSLHLCEYYVNSFSGGGGGAQYALGFPDLTLTNKMVTPAAVAAGGTVTASFVEANQSATAIAGAHRVQFYLSADTILTPGANGDALLGEQLVPSVNNASGTGMLTKQLLVPCNTTNGNYTLFFVADAGNNVAESNETNNLASTTLVVNGSTPSPAVPVITASPATACTGTPVTLTISNPACSTCTYRWNTGAVGTSIQVTTSGMYVVTASNACAAVVGNLSVTFNPPPTFTATASSNSVCAGSSVTLNASSGATNFTWSGPGLNATTGTSVTATPPTAGLQTYTVTGMGNGCTATKTIILTVNALPSISITPPDTLICAGTAVTLTASGAATYSWSPAATLNTSSGASVVAVPASNTTYTAAGMLNGCSNTATRSISLTNSVTPSVTITMGGCSGNSLLFTASAVNGGLNPQYQWYVNNVLQGVSSNSFTLNNASNGTIVYAKMISSLACAAPQTVNAAPVTVSCITTAVGNVDDLEEFIVSPNPGNGLFFVALKLTRLKKISLQVMNAAGVVVYSMQPQNSIGTTTKKIDLRGKSAGLYYLKVAIGNDTVTEKIILVQ